MISLEALLLLTALSAPGDVVLVQFTAPWCGACRQVEPIVERLASDGYRVNKVDVEADRALARQYGITAVPTFVLLADGREVDRVVGPASYDRLTQMFAAARAPQSPDARRGESGGWSSSSPMAVRGQSPDAAEGRAQGGFGAAPPKRFLDSGGADVADARFADARSSDARFADVHGNDGRSSGPTQGPGAFVPTELRESTHDIASGRALRPDDGARQATVRLTVEDSTGFSHGTGTIIDTYGDEALVLTCGHIFRDSKGEGRITVELFAPGAKGPIAGELVRYDAERIDLGLVSIRPGCAVTPVPVAGRGRAPQVRDRVFSIGCDHGGQPRVAYSRVTAIDRYVGPPNYEVAGQPVQGRSGGGLFTADGQLIGVCNAADQADDEGIYAALPSVHQELAMIGMERIFEQGESRVAAVADGRKALGPDDAVRPERPLSPSRQSMPLAPPDDSYAGDNFTARGNAVREGVPSLASGETAAGSPYIVIVPAGHTTDGHPELLVLEQISPGLLEQLRSEHRRQQDRASSLALRDLPAARRDLPRELPSSFRRETSSPQRADGGRR